MIIIDNPGARLNVVAGAPVLYNYPTHLIAPSFEVWLPDSAKVTKDGSNRVSAWAGQKSSGGVTLSQAVSASQPLWQANQIDGRPALYFTQPGAVAPDRFVLTNFPAGAALSFSIIAVVRAPARQTSTSTTHIIIGDDSTTMRLENIWSLNDGERVAMRCGASLTATAGVTRPVNEWYFVVGSWNHVLGQSAVSINGGSFVLSSNTGASVSATTVGIGARPTAGSVEGLQADIAMLGIYPAALHLSANAGPLAIFKEYARSLFPSLTIA